MGDSSLDTVPLRSEDDVKAFLIANNGPSCNRKRLRSLIALSNDEYEKYKVNVIVSQSCKRMDLHSAMDAYKNIKAQSLTPTKDTFFMLLCLVAGFGEQGSGSYPIREADPPSDPYAAQLVFADMKTCEIPLTESCYTAMIRCYSSHNRLSDALGLFYEMINDALLQPKLRTFSSLFAAMADSNDLSNAFLLYDCMTKRFEISPSEKEYECMLRITANKQDNRFYSILEQTMEDILVPTSHLWSTLMKWFTAKINGYGIQESSVSDDGVVSYNSSVLKSIDLDDFTRAQLLQQISTFALTRAYTNNRSTQSTAPASLTQDDKHSDEEVLDKKEVLNNDLKDTNETEKLSRSEMKWAKYTSWLDEHRSDFTIVVDGANVGFYKQNFAGAPLHVEYVQINWLLDALKAIGHKPLLILHQRHTSKDRLPTKFAPIVNSWREQNIIYETPPGWNDDWFWMFACVRMHCHIVTNDEMRDHHFQMLSPRWFGRWKERRVVHFQFGKWVNVPSVVELASEDIIDQVSKKPKRDDEHGNFSKNYREAIFNFPRVFSYRMQALGTIGEHGTEYYFPASDKTTWLCALPLETEEYNQSTHEAKLID